MPSLKPKSAQATRKHILLVDAAIKNCPNDIRIGLQIKSFVGAMPVDMATPDAKRVNASV